MFEGIREDLRGWIDIATWIDDAEVWLQENLDGLFGLITDVVSWLIQHILDFLLWPPEMIAVLIFAGIAWWARSWSFGLVALVGFLLIDIMDLWEQAMETLSLVLVAALLAVAIGVPVGIAASRNAVVSTVVRPVLDFMQTMPAFVYLIPTVAFFRLGPVPGTVATIVFALPPAVRLTELGIRQVDPEIVEAGEAFGTAPRRILTRIQIPLAMPTIMAGVNQVIMLSLSMVVIASLVGAPGLGTEVYQSITRLETGRGFEGGLGVVILAIFLDRVTSGINARVSTRTHELENA